jgi:hypothetical protein
VIAFGPVALARVVYAITRAIRAMGYYDSDHPVFEQAKREAFAAVGRARRSLVTLGSGGRQLVVDEDGGVLADASAADLAARMFNLSVVAIRIHERATADELGVLTKIFAEGPEQVRAHGGAKARLDAEGVRGIEVVEVDFAALFSGQNAELGPLVGGDSIAELALKAILRFKDDDDQKSDALAVSLDRLSTPESLGDFLDGLLDRAEPGVVSEAKEEWGALSSDDLADHAARAFLANQQQLSGQTQALAESARVLSEALVRLAPDARFALLRKLAGKDASDSTQEEQAVARLGEHVRDGQVVEAIASALMDRSSDSDTVRAIGNLIRRVRPVEAERRRLLAQVDDDMSSRKKPIDGVLWQQIQAQALGDRALGLLEINLAKNKSELARAVSQRRRGKVRAVPGQDVLHTFDHLALLHRAARALGRVIDEAARLNAGLVSAAEEMVARLVEHDDEESVLDLLGALVRRMDRDRDGVLEAAVKKLLVGERGAIWSAKLLSRGRGDGRMMGELILNALEGAGDREYQNTLLDRLAEFDHASLLELGEQAASSDPIRASHLVRAALRADSKVGVKIAKIALKNESYKAKELALKALIESPSVESLSVLAQVAGWKGEKYALAILGLKNAEGLRVHKLQLAAVGALGMSHSPAAAKPLFELLTQKRLFENKEVEEIRLAAAQALLTNGTAEGRRALEEGAKHKKPAVRDVCTRVLSKRRAK